MGIVPLVSLSLFNLGFIYATLSSMIFFIILLELFIGTAMLIRIVYSKENERKQEKHQKKRISSHQIHPLVQPEAISN